MRSKMTEKIISRKTKSPVRLKGCPFCGGKPVMYVFGALPPECPDPFVVIECPKRNNCLVWPTASGAAAEEAAIAWNTRSREVKHA